MNICTVHSVSLIHQDEIMFTLEESMKAHRYSFTLPLTSVLDGGQGSTTRSSLWDTDPSTRSTGGWVGPRASLDRYQTSCSHHNSVPRLHSLSQVTIPTMLSWPTSLIFMIYDMIFINCNWVVTRWQYTFTHKQYTEEHK
jgi:hypothetical protein